MRRIHLGNILLLAAVIEAIGLVANAAASFATQRAAGPLRWLVPPAIALAAAMIKSVVDAYGSPRPPADPRTWQPGSAPNRPVGPRRRRGRTPLVVAIVVVLLACGGGGFAATAGVRYAVGWATGNEDGPDRLVRPATGTAGNLVVTVERVRHTAHFTRLDVERRNVGDTPVSLPLFGFCTLTAQDGTTLEADPFRSRWSETIAADTLTRGTVTFRGRLSPETTRATLAFSQVFGPRGGSLTVRVQLRPPPP